VLALALAWPCVIASACTAVPAGVARPVHLEWAPTARKISAREHSSPCARADFQEEWPFIGPQVESCCFPFAQKKAAVTDSPLQSANTGGGFLGSPSFSSSFFSERIDFEITLSLPSVCMGWYICVHSSVAYVCAFACIDGYTNRETRIQRETRTERERERERERDAHMHMFECQSLQLS